jgi:branched-chain amino acid transport system permease protein
MKFIEGLISAGIIGVRLDAQHALVSIGLKLVFGVVGAVNFAKGGFSVLSGYFAYTLSQSIGAKFIFAILIALLATRVRRATDVLSRPYVIKAYPGEGCVL